MESPTLEQSSSKKQYDEPSNSFAQDAKLATDKEQSMTLMQGIRLYPKAIGWSIVISGYDLCLLGNFCESREFPA
jgi:SP family general alpha glucoside:H+ symporter-like MFS transporter